MHDDNPMITLCGIEPHRLREARTREWKRKMRRREMRQMMLYFVAPVGCALAGLATLIYWAVRP